MNDTDEAAGDLAAFIEHGSSENLTLFMENIEDAEDSVKAFLSNFLNNMIDVVTDTDHKNRLKIASKILLTL
jgi:predicted protein tyrosine phosphatase